MSGPVTRIMSKASVPYELTAVHRDTHDAKTLCFALPDNAIPRRPSSFRSQER